MYVNMSTPVNIATPSSLFRIRTECWGSVLRVVNTSTRVSIVNNFFVHFRSKTNSIGEREEPTATVR